MRAELGKHIDERRNECYGNEEFAYVYVGTWHDKNDSAAEFGSR